MLHGLPHGSGARWLPPPDLALIQSARGTSLVCTATRCCGDLYMPSHSTVFPSVFNYYLPLLHVTIAPFLCATVAASRPDCPDCLMLPVGQHAALACHAHAL